MKFLKYFFYLAYNWDLKIALHIIRNEVRGEKKYGIDTTGADELKSLEDKGIDITHATVYMPASYDLLEDFLDRFNLPFTNHFLDIGCGKGRAMCVAAANGAKKISGIELSKELYAAANENMSKTKSRYPLMHYALYNNDAFYFEIAADVDCIFMFNPFDDVIMSAVLENIDSSLEKDPRPLTVIYINPLQRHLLAERGYKETYHFQKMKYLEGSIFVK